MNYSSIEVILRFFSKVKSTAFSTVLFVRIQCYSEVAYKYVILSSLI